MDNIRSKLNIVQSKLVAPKGQNNTFGKYRYRSNEDILEAVKPLLSDVGAIITQSDSIEYIGDRFYVCATSTFIDCESGEEICNTAYARESTAKKGMDEAQITGSSSSYARKYSLNGLLLIDDTKDSDTMDNTKHHETPQEPQKPWLNDTSKLLSTAKLNGWSGEEAVTQARTKYAVSTKTADEIKKAMEN